MNVKNILWKEEEEAAAKKAGTRLLGERVSCATQISLADSLGWWWCHSARLAFIYIFADANTNCSWLKENTKTKAICYYLNAYRTISGYLE